MLNVPISYHIEYWIKVGWFYFLFFFPGIAASLFITYARKWKGRKRIALLWLGPLVMAAIYCALIAITVHYSDLGLMLLVPIALSSGFTAFYYLALIIVSIVRYFTGKPHI